MRPSSTRWLAEIWIEHRLVDGIAVDLFVRAESNKLIKLVDQLPADLRQGYPMLCIFHAWALHFMGTPEWWNLHYYS